MITGSAIVLLHLYEVKEVGAQIQVGLRGAADTKWPPAEVKPSAAATAVVACSSPVDASGTCTGLLACWQLAELRG